MLLLSAVAVLSLAVPQDTASAAPVKEKKICRSVEATGTILGGKRECHTRREWKAIDDASQADRENRSRSSGSERINRREM